MESQKVMERYWTGIARVKLTGEGWEFSRVCANNPSTWEVGVEGSEQVQGHFQQNSEFKVSQGYMTSCCKQINKTSK